MAQNRVTGCGCIGIGLLAVLVLGPILTFIQKAGWLLLVGVVIAAAYVVYERITRKRATLVDLEKFVDEVAGTATFIVFDTETSGLYPEEGARIVQIAMVALDEKLVELGRFATVINPHGDVGKSDLHGVTKTKTFFAPDFPEVAKLLHSALSGKARVAHNAEFDEKFIQMEFERAGMPKPGGRVIDTLALARKYVKGALNYKLITLVSDLEIDLRHSPSGGAHDALYDAWCCGEVLKAICIEAKMDPKSLTSRS